MRKKPTKNDNRQGRDRSRSANTGSRSRRKRRESTLPELEVLPEPMLEFQYGELSPDPHEGLALFGPWDTGRPEQPKRISYAIIGTPEGTAALREFLILLQTGAQVVLPELSESADDDERARVSEKIASKLQLWPTYPAFEAAFRAELPVVPARTVDLDRAKLLQATEIGNDHARANTCVTPFVDGLAKLKERDEVFDMVFCVVPEEVHKTCRPESKVYGDASAHSGRQEAHDVARGQSNLFLTPADREKYEYSVDFRRQLKARAMSFGMPIQIIRESTLRPNDEKKPGTRGLTPLSDRAWNLATTGYYKAGGRPWRLHGVRDGVCYVGIAFKQLKSGDDDRSACSAAQMFLDTGDGVVFRGTDGRWWSPEDKQFHLSRNAARDLLAGVLTKYQEFEGRELREVFVHARSELDQDEIQGLQEACPAGAKLVVVRIQRVRKGMRLFREGKYPVIRGTFMSRGKRRCYLWTSGFKPIVGSYDGWETPAPLEMWLQHGEADIRQVALDVLGLTKLNYNACKLGESEPVTIKFSDVVGEILVSNPGMKKPEPKFKFYI